MKDLRTIVALDFATAREARELVDRLDPRLCRLKIGKQLFTAEGPAFVEEVMKAGFEVFLDLKFHDIPNTVAEACRAAASLGVWMVNVHALGGRRMMEAAAEAVSAHSRRPQLIAVTVLTSMEQSDLEEVGIDHPVEEMVTRLARLSADCGLDGVVSSAREVSRLNRVFPDGVFVTPGIRPAGSAAGDQRRIVTPADAVRDGATHLVVGRPVTQAAEPLEVLDRINEEIRTAKGA